MKELLKIGFQRVGHWKLVDGMPVYELTAMMNSSNILYAFVCNGVVKYLGKSVRPLRLRMNGFQDPGPSQRTNIRNNNLIKETLLRREPVDIYALADNGLLHYGEFHINLAAGLEDSIVLRLKPEWNKAGISLSRIDEPDKRPANVSTTAFSAGRKDTSDVGRKMISKTTANTVFGLLLHKTYYNKGFFNVTVDFDRYFGKDREKVDMQIGDSQYTISGHINRTANTNGTARIMGGVELRKWFKSNFKVNDIVDIEILSPNSLRLRKH